MANPTSAPLTSMREALIRHDLFGEQLRGPSWAPWRAMLLAIAGEPLEPDELALFQTVTGRVGSPLEPVREFVGVIGRRGGKSRAMAVLTAWLACCRDYRAVLAPGERGEVLLLAATGDQAKRTLNFIGGALGTSRTLRKLVAETTADKIALRTGIDIVVRAASYRSARGGTSVGVVCDEVASWRDEGSANPDVEILRAVRPSLLTTKGPLIMISSPYSTKGELYQAHARYYGVDNPRVLVAQAATHVMNPSVDMADIEQAYADDPIAASAEYGAQFRAELDALVTPDAVAAVTAPGILERAPEAYRYHAFVDPAGGSGKDAMTLGIAYSQGLVSHLAAIREVRPPFSPSAVVTEFASLLKTYRVTSVTGDRWGGEFVGELFAKSGIRYEQADLVRSELYLELLPMINSRRCVLLDDRRLLGQLLALERRATSGGRDKVDHGKSSKSHDDLINAAAGALVMAASKKQPLNISPALLQRAATPAQPSSRYSKPRAFF